MSRRTERNDAQAFDDAWSGRTPRDVDIAALVRSTEKFLEAAAVEPDVAFRDGLRSDLMTAAASVLVTTPKQTAATAPPARTTTSPARRRIAGLTAALVASMGAVGMVTSSASALPGDALYPVKRGVENVALAFHRGDASEGSFQLARATERLAEARALADDGQSAELVSDVLNDFSSQAGSGAESLFSDYTKTGSTESIDKVNDFAASSSTMLAELSSRLPAGVGSALDQAAGAVGNLATEASLLCSTCLATDVQLLVDAVSRAASGTPTEPQSSSSDDTKKPSAEAPEGTPSIAPTVPVTTPKPIIAVPQPTAPPTSLTDITDPLVGVLLGDDEQQGLVPGLLGGLLGGNQK